MPAAPESSRGGAVARDVFHMLLCPLHGALSAHWRTLATSLLCVWICMRGCLPSIQSQTMPMQAFSTEGFRSESIATTYPCGPGLLWSARYFGTLFAL